MQKFKDRWEIQANWQLLFPALGLIGLLISSFLLSKRLVSGVFKLSETDESYILALSLITLFLFIPLLGLTLRIFNALEKKWNVTYRWELIAIFIAFAITGSTAARVSDPLLTLIGLSKETTSGWIYWPLRVFLIFPIYQVILLIVGWLFGQFKFFWWFEKKMLRRMGFAKFLD
ncbi:hypothetical protein SAMN04487910_0868 [Aquimarina amphilecti]|uniref:DUF6787 domain-containing protein n=1 Tax=Aquimarina amphilecti TaxID=1038014 RepID=A0A1H7I5T2_AQUAM|nr:DUF6787 family protein [Aquimarina amphilecti]SEK57901.1 hypothetical protein SAMN04487910_0868 [Aquimarina amphilecti]